MRPDSEFSSLRVHNLKHLPHLRIRHGFLGNKFAAGCSTGNCRAACCKQGVLVDEREQENILAHADMVGNYMEPLQEKDPAQWFGEIRDDTDFPSGKAVPTQVKNYGCVFLDSSGRCVLQKAAMAEGMHRFALKPFFCVTYPVTIEDGEVIIDDPDFTYRTECCSTVGHGTLNVLEVCSEELEFMLGRDGLKELKALAGKEHSSRT